MLYLQKLVTASINRPLSRERPPIFVGGVGEKPKKKSEKGVKNNVLCIR